MTVWRSLEPTLFSAEAVGSVPPKIFPVGNSVKCLWPFRPSPTCVDFIPLMSKTLLPTLSFPAYAARSIAVIPNSAVRLRGWRLDR